MSNWFNTSVTFKISARQALFTDPLSKDGQNKDTLLVPTKSALIGICKRIYNNPAIEWKIKKVRVMNEIQTNSKGMTSYFHKINSEKNNKIVFNRYLLNVSYEVRAYFVPKVQSGFNPLEHLARIKKSIAVGGYQEVFLGTKEGLAYIEPVTFGEEPSFYDDVEEENLGLSVSHIRYDKNGDISKIFFFDVMMYKGVIYFPKEKDCYVRNVKQEQTLLLEEDEVVMQ